MFRRFPYESLSIILALLLPVIGHSEDVTIRIQADQVLHEVSPLLTGACIEDVNHEIYGGIYSQMIFGESFQEPAPTPALFGFKAYGGQWHVTEDGVRIDARDGPKLISDIAAFADGKVGVEVLIKDRSGVNAGLILRTSEPGIGADRFFGYEVSLDSAHQTLLLARHRGNFEPIKAVKCAVPIGRWIRLEVKLAGSAIEILVDGKSLLNHDDADKALRAGSVGLRAWHCRASFRSLQVTTGARSVPIVFKYAEPATEISGMWRAVHAGTAAGRFAIETVNAFTGVQSQAVSYDSGAGRLGVENQGLNRQGMSLIAGKAYEGYVWARAEKPCVLFASLESRDGKYSHARAKLLVTAKSWQRLDFSLTPTARDTAGRFVLALEQPGSVVIGHAFLQPGDWGRFKGLPVRRDVAEGLIDQGITVLRYGGSMVNNHDYKWKNMIGPRDRRPPYAGTWYPWSTNGWGILDFMDFCEAARFEYVPAFNMAESPRDMADFIEYAKGDANTAWGRKRIAGGHPNPYRLRVMELGNEERLDEEYALRFERIARAIWGKDRDIILVVGDFAYGNAIVDPMNFTGAASGITTLAAHRSILALAREHDREVWFDVHLGTEGPGRSNDLNALPAYVDALGKVASGAKHKAVVFEYNSQNHAVRRALGNALATHAIMRDGRVPIVTSANCLQPDQQNDNGWDQGLLFLNPSRVWLQPPGYITQIFSRNRLPKLVKCDAAPGRELDVVATRSDDAKTLVLQVVNTQDRAVPSSVRIPGFSPGKAIAKVTTLSGPLDATNTSDKQAVKPETSDWKHGFKDGVVRP
jgi:hypothetical protein